MFVANDNQRNGNVAVGPVCVYSVSYKAVVLWPRTVYAQSTL